MFSPRFLARHRALLLPSERPPPPAAVLLLGANYSNEVTPLSSNPAGLLCMVAADGDLLC
jgi:hypothetical protein